MRGLERIGAASAGCVHGLLALMYPPHCPLCETSFVRGRDARFVCADCLSALDDARIRAPYCLRCGAPLSQDVDLCEGCAHRETPFERARSFGLYEGPLARLIQLMKFGRERALASELARPLARALGEGRERDRGRVELPAEAITFVPMSAKSQRARGFNQAELLARCLEGRTGRPVHATLRKARETRAQVELAGQERRENMVGAFAPLGPARCDDILLVDDVFTTGATVEEGARALLDAGYERVFVLTLARTPRGRGAAGAQEVGELPVEPPTSPESRPGTLDPGQRNHGSQTRNSGTDDPGDPHDGC